MKDRNQQEKYRSLRKERWNLRHLEIQEMDLEGKDDWFWSGLSIIMWYVILQCNYNLFQVTGKNKFLFYFKPGSDTKKTLSRPASQIRENGVATRVGDAYMQGKYLTYKR